MKPEILFILLNDYADWEPAFLASALYGGVTPGSDTKYTVKTVAPTREPVHSIGGFTTLPDYSFETMPKDYAALILAGGMQWNSPESEQLVPIVQATIHRHKPVGAICNAASFLAAHGFLNHIKHTGNTVEQLKEWGKANYTNEAGYVGKQAVTDQCIVTANGTGYLEFCREMLLLLQADTEEHIRQSYTFFKEGFYKE